MSIFNFENLSTQILEDMRKISSRILAKRRVLSSVSYLNQITNKNSDYRCEYEFEREIVDGVRWWRCDLIYCDEDWTDREDCQYLLTTGWAMTKRQAKEAAASEVRLVIDENYSHDSEKYIRDEDVPNCWMSEQEMYHFLYRLNNGDEEEKDDEEDEKEEDEKEDDEEEKEEDEDEEEEEEEEDDEEEEEEEEDEEELYSMSENERYTKVKDGEDESESEDKENTEGDSLIDPKDFPSWKSMNESQKKKYLDDEIDVYRSNTPPRHEIVYNPILESPQLTSDIYGTVDDFSSPTLGENKGNITAITKCPCGSTESLSFHGRWMKCSKCTTIWRDIDYDSTGSDEEWDMGDMDK